MKNSTKKKHFHILLIIGIIIIGIMGLVVALNFQKKDSGSKNNNQTPPTVSEIEEKYQNDKQKNEIVNATDLNESEKKQAEENLKKLIEVEIDLKRKRLNLRLINELRELKVKNTKIYQKLNKDGRVDKATGE